jgi:hypothetical protein
MLRDTARSVVMGQLTKSAVTVTDRLGGHYLRLQTALGVKRETHYSCRQFSVPVFVPKRTPSATAPGLHKPVYSMT